MRSCMVVFIFKKSINSILLQILIIVVLSHINTYAGSIIEVDGSAMYKNDQGEIAKDTWVWIDTNNDSIAECYRFDKDGHLAKNYTHYDGKKTNDKGQYIEDGIVVKKMLSTGRLLTESELFIGPRLEDKNHYIKDNIILDANLERKEKLKLDRAFDELDETIENDENIDGQVINNIIGRYDPLSNIVPDSGVIYSKEAHTDVIIGRDGEIIPGINATKFISSSYRFNKEVKDAHIYNGEVWDTCMEMQGNKSRVKFLLNKYNYIYFEISNENHINGYNVDTDMALSIYADNKLLEEIDDFYNGEPQVVELDLDNAKTLELRLNVKSGSLLERVYIHNARLRKIKDED